MRVDHAATGLTFFGAIDDLWVDSDGCHYVVDYKATAKSDEVSLDADWQVAYKCERLYDATAFIAAARDGSYEEPLDTATSWSFASSLSATAMAFAAERKG